MRANNELGRYVSRLRRRLPLTRYDLILAVIPLALLLTVGVAGLLGLSHRAALVGWVVLGLFALVDALFLNPPTSGGRVN